MVAFVEAIQGVNGDNHFLFRRAHETCLPEVSKVMLGVVSKRISNREEIKNECIVHGENPKGNRVVYAETGKIMRTLDQIQGVILMMLKDKTTCNTCNDRVGR